MDERIIRKKLEILKNLAVVDSRQKISPWRGRAARHIGPGEYEYLGPWGPVEDVSRWPALQTVFLQATVQAPDDWDLARTFFSFDFADLEGLLSVDGRPWA